jgi:3-deoxy-7-phosphoheptulonate synthase
MKELTPPLHLIREFAVSDLIAETIAACRTAFHRILHGQDDRVLVVIGPCSIHDPKAAMEYARRLIGERERLKGELEIVMRVYFEKPGVAGAWKGLINDPRMDGSFRINDGLRAARELLLDINALGLPAGTEFLDVISPQYIADLISWGGIGGQTTESQIHREMASGLSCPIGFQNGTGGNVLIAVDAIKAASQPHHFLGVTKSGHSAIVSTSGNEDCHVVLRGGNDESILGAAAIEAAYRVIAGSGLASRLMIDVSRANGSKNPASGIASCTNVARQVAAGDSRIVGVMVESDLLAGGRDIVPGKELAGGQTVSDDVIGWNESLGVLQELANAVTQRRLMGDRAA